MKYVMSILMILISLTLFILGVVSLTFPSFGLAAISFTVSVGFGIFAYHDIKLLRNNK
jgi:hypothetical protein